ncbi:MAG TPA: GPW/gp25 family protein [Candidatus Binataceae bacterium]|nr:GPW/gp25 family protein [Candidatus Binataceae bacterium]
MNRNDYAFPFRIDSVSQQAALTNYETHVDQMIRQVLLTSPGERVDLPDFGCGLRRILFSPNSDAMAATTQVLVLQALNKWLAGQIQVQKVTVVPPSTAPDPAQLLIQIDYLLLETQTTKTMLLPVI